MAIWVTGTCGVSPMFAACQASCGEGMDGRGAQLLSNRPSMHSTKRSRYVTVTATLYPRLARQSSANLVAILAHSPLKQGCIQFQPKAGMIRHGHAAILHPIARGLYPGRGCFIPFGKAKARDRGGQVRRDVVAQVGAVVM